MMTSNKVNGFTITGADLTPQMGSSQSPKMQLRYKEDPFLSKTHTYKRRLFSPGGFVSIWQWRISNHHHIQTTNNVYRPTLVESMRCPDPAVH